MPPPRTSIDQLELLDLDGPQHSSYSQSIERENVARESSFSPIKSKMRNNVDHALAMNGGQRPMEIQYQPQPQPQRYQDYFGIDDYQLGPKAMQKDVKIEPFVYPMNCIDINSHIKGCPLCSRFYDTSTTIYIVIILILIATMIFLSKKLMDKNS